VPQESTSDRLDVAIVGGGVSGLYAAWRLLTVAREKGGPTPKVVVYELSDRVGGRLLTWLPAGSGGGLRAELGGMRVFEQQELVWSLLPALGFGAEDIIDFPVAGKNLRLLLRGEGMPLETKEPTKRYLVTDDERNQQAGALIVKVIETVLGTTKNAAVLKEHLGGRKPTSRKDWDTVKPYLTWEGLPRPGLPQESLPLWNVGFWNLLSELRSSEAYQYISDAFGYYSLSTNWNAAEAMQEVFLDFTEKPQYKTLREGMGALPQALAKQVTSLGGQIVLNTRLASFEAPTKAEPVTAELVNEGGAFQVQARALVLGLPRRSLQLLTPTRSFDLPGDDSLRRLFDSATPTPAFKLFLFFDERWWEELGITKGRSICDLPIRQTYYFRPDTPPIGPVPDWGLLMASYDDERAVDYWQGLVPPEDQWPKGRDDLHKALIELTRRMGVGGEEGYLVPQPPPNLHKAPPLMIAHALEQLALLHGIPMSKIPPPVAGAFADWSFDPFGGGWNFWQPQVDVREAMTKIKQPLGAGRNVYVVGEAYSGAQGWIEGALSATEVTLQKYFGLPWPKWMLTDVYLGW
jgi:monoamine oxidase